MKTNNSIILSVIMTGFISVNTIATTVNSKTQSAASQTGAMAVTEISFKKGSTDLSDSARTELQRFIADANKKGTIKEVRVAAWSDQEYPHRKKTVSEGQIDLAQKRAIEIRAYLEKNLNVASVSMMNMAKRPNMAQDSFKTESANTKNTLEDAGAAPTTKDQMGLFGLKGKASEAIVMVYLK